MNLYFRILKFAKPHQKYIYGSLFFNILYSLLQIASIGTLLPVLGILFGTEKQEIKGDGFSDNLKRTLYTFINNEIEKHGSLNVLLWLCIITGVAFFLRNIVRYLGAYLLIFYRVGVTKDLRGSMYRKILTLPVSFFSEQRKGDLMSRMSNDVGEVENNILGSLVDLVNSPFMLIGTLASLFF